MTYQVARYTTQTTMEVQPGWHFWKRSAQKAADTLNGAQSERGPIVRAFSGPQGTWKVFGSRVLASALALAQELERQRQDVERRKARTERLRADLAEIERRYAVEAPFMADTLAPGTAVSVQPRQIPWLDEDPTSGDGLRFAEPEDTDGGHDEVRPAHLAYALVFPPATPWAEENWDTANGGSLKGGKELPVRVPADEIVNTTEDMTPEDAEKAWAGVVFVPQEVTLSPAVDEFLADAPVAVKRPARKRPARRLDSIIDDPAL